MDIDQETEPSMFEGMSIEQIVPRISKSLRCLNKMGTKDTEIKIAAKEVKSFFKLENAIEIMLLIVTQSPDLGNFDFLIFPFRFENDRCGLYGESIHFNHDLQ